MNNKPTKAQAISIKDGDEDNTCAAFTAFCKEENLVMTGILKGYMRLYMEEHYRNQKILEKARLVPVYKSNYDRNNAT